MTRIGKCDVCRARKVKCDEAKPICGACAKKNRPCTYTYGRPATILVDEHSTFSVEGETNVQPPPTPSTIDQPCAIDRHGGLQVTSTKDAGKGHGVFHILSLANRGKNVKKRSPAIQKGDHPTPPKATLSASPLNYNPLAARLHRMFGLHTLESDSRSIYGSWVEALPSRLGASTVLDSVIEYSISSYASHKDNTLSVQRTALVSRSRALKALRQAIQDYDGKPSHDLVLATKLLSLAEIYIDVGKFTAHSVGLSELLKLGAAAGLDEGYHWSLVEKTYYDEVVEALMSGRPSVYDTARYLSMTNPLTFQPNALRASEYQLELVSIMHCMVQIPRLACLVRRSISEPADKRILAFALLLAQTLWALDPSPIIDTILETSAQSHTTPPSSAIEDIVDITLTFDSLRALLVCARYWSFRIHLCALIQTLWKHFPEHSTKTLPKLDLVQAAELEAAKKIAQSLPYSLSFSESLSLVPLRVLGSLALSVGPWYRLIQRLKAELESLKPASVHYIWATGELEKANRMEEWVIEECNKIHSSWGIGRADRNRFEALIPLMAGEEIPDWIPNKVGWQEAKAQMVRQGTYFCSDSSAHGGA